MPGSGRAGQFLHLPYWSIYQVSPENGALYPLPHAAHAARGAPVVCAARAGLHSLSPLFSRAFWSSITMKRNPIKRKLGYTLIEVLVALFVVAMGAIMYTATLPMAAKGSRMVGNYQQASSLVQ